MPFVVSDDQNCSFSAVYNLNYVRSLTHLTAQDANSHVGYIPYFFAVVLVTNLYAEFVACLLTNMIILTVMCWLSLICFVRAVVNCIANLSQDDIAFYINNVA